MILADWKIKALAARGMISDFQPEKVKVVEGNPVISYGLQSFGYDIRIANEFKVFRMPLDHSGIVDPKNMEPRLLQDFRGDVCIIPPNSFALARSVEYFKMPSNVTGVVLGKSTYARCFSGDTQIALVDNTSITFEDLTRQHESGKHFFGYGVDSDGQVIVQMITAPRFIGRDSLLEITLDNGKKIKCTPDHEFVLRNGEREISGNLRQGASLMPLYRYNSRGYETVFHPGLGKLEGTHRLSDRWNIRHGLYKPGENEDRHHIDGNKRNNNPFNIERVASSDHALMHNNEYYGESFNANAHGETVRSAIRYLYENDPQWRELFSAAQRKKAIDFWNEPQYADARDFLAKKRLNSWSEERRSDARDRMLNRMSIPEERLRVGVTSKMHWDDDDGSRRLMQAEVMRQAITKHNFSDSDLRNALREAGSIRGAARILGCDRSVFRRFPDVVSEFKTNHKVVSVKELKGVHDVYCLTMPETGNFALNAGVFVSNCGIVANFTPLEAGWEGIITIEISNTSPLPAKVYANEGFAQVLLFEGDEPEHTYGNGKYQSQVGITLAKV